MKKIIGTIVIVDASQEEFARELQEGIDEMQGKGATVEIKYNAVVDADNYIVHNAVLIGTKEE